MTYLILAMVVLAGCGQPFQIAANARLRDAVRSPVLGAAISFVVGTIALTVLALIGFPGSRGRISEVLQAPWWAWIGGLLGAFSVIMAIVAIKRSNEATVIAFTIVGQLSLSVIIDHFGWLDVPQTRISSSRVIGVVLLALGAFLIHRN